MTAWWEFLGWLSACVAVHHHSARLRAVGCYDSAHTAGIVAEYDTAHDHAAQGARLAGRTVKNRSRLAPWLREARLLHRQCGSCPTSKEASHAG